MRVVFTPRKCFSAVLVGLAAAACHPTAPGEKSVGGSAKPVAVATARLNQINVFVDMSGGMQGFVHPVAPGDAGSGFQQTVTELLSDVNGQQAQQATPPAYYFFKESTPADPRLLVPSTYAEMTSTVSGGLKNAARGSELPQMLSEALKLQAQKPGTVSVLISDFIFAPKQKGETWKIKTFIKDALSEVPASKLAVSVFVNTSAYRGNFYPGNRTGPQPLTGEPIPYYIWVLGDPALVGQLDVGLLRHLAGQPQAHFNVRFAPPAYALLETFEEKGSWMATTDAAPAAPLLTFTKRPGRRDTADVVLGLNLRDLPASVSAHISAQTLRLASDSVPATLARVWPLAQVRGQAANQQVARYTHFVKLRFAQAPATRSTLRLELARPNPDWIADYSIDSDSDIKTKGAKTFHLTEVLTGVADYFADQPSAQRVFSLPVRVEARD